MTKNNKFYISTPIYYVNAQPHIGHTYTTVAADVLARFHRLQGDISYFATGTDEHGTKIQQKADEAKKEPQVFADEVAAKFELAWDELNISNNRFIRTTSPDHKKAVQNALQYMYDKGDIYLDKYEGLYCTGCEQFKSEKDLVDGKCPDHQKEPEQMSEETYVFKMSKYSDQLREMIERDELEIRPIEKKNEILSFYKEGLKDVSFSRQNVSWGIPLPWDKTHTAYVWSDAFLNYLTILDWDGSGSVLPPEYNDSQMWPADVQLMSKDILRVHSSIWPAMLLSLELPVQKKIFVHGFFLIDGQKMSKSIGNVIAPLELVERYGVDASRYLLMSATTFGRDGDIGFEKFDEKFTADLANGIGNLVARTTTLINKLRDSGNEIPDCCKRPVDTSDWGGSRWESDVDSAWSEYQKSLSDCSIDKSLALAMGMVAKMDQYLADNTPWKTMKDNPEEAAIVLYNTAEHLRHIALMMQPFMPDTSEEILRRLGLNHVEEYGKGLDELKKFGLWDPRLEVEKGEPLFPRLS